jgi:RHS repeat-associated protein
MTDGTGTSSYTWDPFGELTSETDGAGQTASYDYEPTGDVAGITYPLPAATWATSHKVTFTYDEAGRLSAVTDFNGNKIAITDNSDDLPASIALGATGDTIATAYDATGSPSSISLSNGSSTLQSFAYSDAPSGDPLSETDTPASVHSPATYTYDGQDRIASMTPGSGTTSAFTFDPSSNLTLLPNGATGTYDNAGELTGSALSGGSTSNYAYNSDGERLSAKQGTTTTASATWNGAAAVTSYSDSAGAMTSAAYDGDGLRQSSAITPAGGSAATQGYVWDTQAQLPQIIMDGTNAYIYANGTVPAEQVNLATGAVTYLITDSLGSVRGAVGSSGSLIGTTSYDAWGNPQAAGGLTATTPFGYAGGYTDADDLVYLQARYYDPTTGQFLSIDPLVAQTLQPYAYANGNPVANIDPSGTTSTRWTIVRIARQLIPLKGPWHDCEWVDWRQGIDEWYCQKSVSVSSEVSGSLEIPLDKVFSSVSLSVSTSTATDTASGGYVFNKKGRVGWIQWAAVQPRYLVNQRKWIGGPGPRGGFHWVATNQHAYATIATSGGATFTFRFVPCRTTPRYGAFC